MKFLGVIASCITTIQIIAMEALCEQKDASHKRLLIEIFKKVDTKTLCQLAQVNTTFKHLAEEATLCGEKKRLFSRILDVTEAEPNTVQAIRHLLERQLGGLPQSSPSLPALVSIKERLIQPEYLIAFLDKIKRDRLLQAKEIAINHEALLPMKTLLADMSQELLREENGSVKKIVQAAQQYYLTYLQELCAPTCDRASYIYPKVLLSGEGLLGGDTEMPHWWQSGFGAVGQAGISSYRISQEMACKLLSKTTLGSSKKKNTEGAHSVAPLQGEYGIVHFKADSQSDGLPVGYESAVFWLSKLLFNRGATATSLLILSDVEMHQAQEGTKARAALGLAQVNNGADGFVARMPHHQHGFLTDRTDHILQAGGHVEGLTLNKFIQEVEAKKCSYDDIELSSFSEQFLLALLSNPYDGNGGNFVVAPHAGGYHIVGIDSDRSFSADVIKIQRKTETSHSLQFKTILACLPLMNRPVAPEVIKQLLAIDGSILFSRWLELISFQEREYFRLTQLQVATTRGVAPNLSKQGLKNCKLPLRFIPEVVLSIPVKIRAIKQYLKSALGATHWDLFLHMNPLVGHFYKTIVQKNKGNPLDAFFQIYQADRLELSLEKVILESELADRKAAELLGHMQFDWDLEARHTHTVPALFAEFLKKVDLYQSENVAELLEIACRSFSDTVPSVKEVSLFDKSWQKERLLLDLIQRGASEFVLRCLIKKGFSSRVIDEKAKTLLHYALEKEYSDEFIKFIVDLFAGTELINQKDGEQRTALDLSMRNKRFAIFNALIKRGAWVCQPQLALELYKNLTSECLESFKLLLERNQEIEWLVSLEEILPPISRKIKGSIITSARLLQRTLPEFVKEQIIDKKDAFIPLPGLTGNHTVARATKRTVLKDHQLYFKEFPELPGIEEAVGALIREFTDFGAPFTDLFEYHGRSVLVSQGMNGFSLFEVLLNNPDLIKNIDPENLSALIVLSFSFNPEDLKPDNIQLVPHPFFKNRYLLSLVDNDHAFVEGVVREKPKTGKGQAPIIQVKSVLYCLDFMNNPVHPEVIKKISAFNPGQFLKKWLDNLELVNQTQRALFSEAKQIELLEKQGSFIGVPIKRGTVAWIYNTLERMRALFVQYPTISHIELLSKLDPRLAKRYRSVLVKNLPALDRFKQLEGPFYGMKPDSFTTKNDSFLILQSYGIPLQESVGDYIKAGKNLGPAGAKRELHELMQTPCPGTVSEMVELDKKEHPAIEKLWESFLSQTDFAQIPEDEQLKVLDAIQNRRLSNLTLKNCIRLLDNWIINRSKLLNLRRVDLRESRAISGRSIVHLAEQAPDLEELNLAGTAITELVPARGRRFILFPQLKSLNLASAQGLKKLSVAAPQLRYLSVADCSKLTDPELDTLVSNAPTLTKLDLKGSYQITERFLRTLYPRLTLAQIRQNYEQLKKEAIANGHFHLGFNYDCWQTMAKPYYENEALKKYCADFDEIYLKTLAYYQSLDIDYSIRKRAFLEFLMAMAARTGYIEVVETLLDRGVKPQNEVLGNYQTGEISPLIQAIQSKQIEIAKLLVARGAGVRFRYQDLNHRSALHYIASLGLDALVPILIEAGADVDAQDDLGSRPLIQTIWARKISTLRLLLQHRADARSRFSLSKDLHDWSPIHFALHSDFLEAIGPLVESGADINYHAPAFVSLVTPLYEAVLLARGATIEKALELGADINLESSSLFESGKHPVLYYAIKSRDLTIVELLLRRGASPKREKEFSEVLGRSPHCLEMMKLLLQYGADPNKFDLPQIWSHYRKQEGTVSYCQTGELSKASPEEIAASRFPLLKVLIDFGFEFSFAQKPGPFTYDTIEKESIEAYTNNDNKLGSVLSEILKTYGES